MFLANEEQATLQKVLGLEDVKFAFLCKKLWHIANKPRICNIALVGAPDCGKTYITNRYESLLYGGRFISTAGNSISMPALRGSARSNRDVKKGNKNRMGLLESYKALRAVQIQLRNELKSYTE